MKRSVTAFGALAIACTVAGRDTPPLKPAAPPIEAPADRDCEPEPPGEDGELADCQIAIAELTAELDEARATVRTRTRVVTSAAPARKCGGDTPKIVHVVTEPCGDGMVCLDARAQRALTLNLAAYEAYVRKVQACESEPVPK